VVTELDDRQVVADTLIIPMPAEVVDEAAALHLAGFAGYMNARLGHRYARAFIDWFRRQPEGICLGAVHDGELAGYVVGAPIGYNRRMNRDLFLVAATSALARPWLFADGAIRRQIRARLKILLGGTRQAQAQIPFPTPAVSLVGICVSPGMHRRSIADRLIDAFEEEARSRGIRTLRLSVYRENAAARRLYEKHGWLPDESGEKDPIDYYLVMQDQAVLSNA